MTVRTVFKIFSIVLGVGFLLALLHSGASFNSNAVWYGIATTLIVGGTLPKQVAWLFGIAAACVFLYGVTWGAGSLPLGLRWGHVLFFIVAAGIFYTLGLPTEIHMWKCPKCFWHGPSTARRFGHCPRCGYAHLQDEHRSVITGA